MDELAAGDQIWDAAVTIIHACLFGLSTMTSSRTLGQLFASV